MDKCRFLFKVDCRGRYEEFCGQVWYSDDSWDLENQKCYVRFTRLGILHLFNYSKQHEFSTPAREFLTSRARQLDRKCRNE